MIERLGLATDPELEAALRELGTALDWPPTPDVAAAVSTRLATSGRPTGGAPDRPIPRTVLAPRRWLRSVPRSVPRSLVLAAAIALLVAGVALGIRFGLDLLRVEFGPVPSLAPPTTMSPGPGASSTTLERLGSSLGLGTRTSLESVQAEAGFPVVVPTDPGLPDGVFLGGQTLRGQVAFVYAPREGLPASDHLDGAGLLITQNRGSVDTGLVRKIVDSGGTVERTTVGDARAYWFAGDPHGFWYLGPDGQVVVDTGRRVGNTLAWERGDILYRIEGEIDLERALEIAVSMP